MAPSNGFSNMNWRFKAIAALAALALTPAFAADENATLTIKDHRFDPAELVLPAGKKVALLVKNLDPTPEEFESVELHREKVVPAGREVTVYIGPLSPGRYGFFGDFNQETAQGAIIV